MQRGAGMTKRQTGPPGAVVKGLALLGVGAVGLYTAGVLLSLFGPQPEFRMLEDLQAPLDSEEFIRFLSLVTNGTRRRSRVRRLKNGAEFYPVALDAIRKAEHAINLEYYEFLPGRVALDYVQALTERARAGVEVRLIVDAVGSRETPDRLFDGLRAAGGQMVWYHPLRWDTWQHMDQRTHRKLLIVDGRTGIMGGAGVADHWLHSTRQEPAWRDTNFCVEGEAVAGMISTFSENWLEASGEILSGAKQFRFHAMPGGAESFVVSSTPRGGGTQARILFQALIKSAQKTIRITTPYFLPDPSARRALVQAVRQRGVKVQILTAGPHIDHKYIRTLSRHASRELLEAGAQIWEYRPAMIHAKTLTVDEQWCVLGSTNFDHRSFALNDEVNLAVLDRDLAKVIDDDLVDDLAQSTPLTLETLRNRTPLGKLEEALTGVLEQES